MRTFKSLTVPRDPKDIPAFLERMQLAIEQAGSRSDPFALLEYRTAAPEKVFAGMVVLADGVEWQPDSVNGEGLYRRNKTNTAWVFLG